VHVDAHADTSDGSQWGEAYHHGTPIRHAIAEGLIARGQLYQIGLRGPARSADDARLVDEHDARRLEVDLVGERGPTPIAQEIRGALGDVPVYLSVDIDAVDPAFAPGTGTPVPGGLTAREALAFVRGLAGIRLVGMDLVEVAPDLDVGDATSLLAAHLLWEGLALRAI
jgi:arginase family enzyme